MTAAPGWGADCGGLTPGPVFPAITLWALGFTEVPGDWGQGADGTGRAEKVMGERGLSQLCLGTGMLSKCSCTLQALPVLSFSTLNGLGSMVTLISEQTLGVIINE